MFVATSHFIDLNSVPLANSRVEDAWYWTWTNNGHYSVKSGYRQLLEVARVDHTPPVTDWRSIWNLSIPPKMKNFMWRVVSCCLPTRAALQSKGVDSIADCPICRHCNEDDVHVLINCSHARAVWSVSAIGSSQEDFVSMADWWNRLKRRSSLAQAEYAAMMAWALWQRRNDTIWNNNTKPPMTVVNQVTQLLDDWKQAKSKEPISTSEQTSHLSKWCKPDAGIVKCNSNASLFTDPHRIGYGCVVRDHNGSFMAGMHGSISGKFTPLLAEALSVREALSWLKGAQLQQVIIESDSLNIIQRLKSSGDGLSSVDLILNDCKSLAKGFNQCVFSFVRRSANSVAHSLARAASSVSGRVCWMSHPPLFISDVLEFDLN